MGGDAEGKFLDMVTLDTKLSWGRARQRSAGGKETDTNRSSRERGGRERERKALFCGFSDRAECLLSSSLTQLCFH